MILQRHLDDIEVPMLNQPAGQVVEYKGCLDQDALAKAFELLCTRYPVIRGRVRRDNQGFLLYVTPDHWPEIIVREGDEKTLQREFIEPWDPARAVAQLMLIRGESRGFVGMRMDHSIVDGRSWTAMSYELWRLYTDVVNGSKISVGRNESLPCPPSRLFNQHLNGIRLTPPVSPLSTPTRTDSFEFRERRIRLSEECTTQLLVSARTSNTSVHGLLCGVILIAQCAQGAPDEPVPMECFSLVDLRRWVTPQVGATETTNFFGAHRAKVIVPINGNPATLGREIKTQLGTATARRKLTPVDTSPAASPQIGTTLEPRLAAIGVTNSGAFRPFAQPAMLTITDWLKVPCANNTTPVYPAYVVHTYGGRLSVLCCYRSDAFTDEEVNQIVERITEKLHKY